MQMSESSHPENELFDFATGRLDAGSARAVEQHVNECAECCSLVDSLAALKAEMSAIDARRIEFHPSVGELAEYFYARPTSTTSVSIAAHLAVCKQCASEIAFYAQAEAAARQSEAGARAVAQVPAAAWKLIRDWEESPFARTKGGMDVPNQELLQKLSELFDSSRIARSNAERGSRPALVEVTVIDRSGQVIGVEMFEQSDDGLKHTGESARYNEKPVHALLDFGGGQRSVVSDRIRGDRIQMSYKQGSDLRPLAEAYFIVEE
jgi:hypothetical protein